MAAITPKDVELISNIKEMQRRELQEKPGPGSGAAPAGKKASTPAASKRSAAKTPTSRTPKTYATVAATSTPSTASTASTATRTSPTIVEDELDLEDLDSFRIPRVSSTKTLIAERMAWEAERRKMQKMMEAFNQQETESEEQEFEDEDEDLDWPPSTRRAVRAKFNYLFSEDKTGEDQGSSKIYTARKASNDAYLKAHWTEWSATDIK